MRRIVAAAIFGAAVAAVSFYSPVVYGQDAPPATQPGAAGNQAAVPVKQVVLFSSGVGYFEHFGSVNGNQGTELRFKSQQINDILKSLVLQDMDGGRITTVTYPSQDPISKTLRSFEVDITNNPSLGELLNQLRGAKVTVVALNGKEVSGTIVGVEKKKRPVDPDKKEVVEIAVMNVLTASGIRAISLEDVQDLRLQDANLRDELEKALAALAQARGQDKKPVTIQFRGEGERRVRIGYVVETPVWKTSYRLILSKEAPAGGAGGGEGDEAAAAAPAKDDGKLQGWAIIENQTDADWDDVQLTLVSGRPISFIQDLYQPLYIPRPVVQQELYASLRPQTYGAGMDEMTEEPQQMRQELKQAQAQQLMRRANRERTVDAGGGGAGLYGSSAGDAESEEAKLGVMDAASSIASVASAAKVGELFQYTVGSVSLPRQKSAMIPIVTDDVEVERLSIYNQSVLPRNPLTGARLKNITKKHLLHGPITVLADGSYAGDAQIDDLPPGQERLLSYGVDQQILVDATKNTSESSIESGKIVKGVLELTRKTVFTQDYLADNKGEKDKTLIIEHPLRQGWKLLEPAKADETTETLYRFRGEVPAGKQSKLTVKQQIVQGESIAILPADLESLLSYTRNGQIPKEVRDAIAHAIQLRYQLIDTDRQIQERQQKIAEITQGEARIRENMKTIAQNTDLYANQLDKLGAEEKKIDTLTAEVENLQAQRKTQQQALEDYLSKLNVR